jgi:hypothetical protein
MLHIFKSKKYYLRLSKNLILFSYFYVFIISIILSFQLFFCFDINDLRSFSNKPDLISEVHAADFGDTADVMTETSIKEKSIYSDLHELIKKSIAGLSDIMSDWFDGFSVLDPKIEMSTVNNEQQFVDNKIDNARSDEGLMIAPLGKEQDAKTLKEKLKSILSDDFIIDRVEKEGYGVIKPVFKNEQASEQGYLFMMVPVIPEPEKE